MIRISKHSPLRSLLTLAASASILAFVGWGLGGAPHVAAQSVVVNGTQPIGTSEVSAPGGMAITASAPAYGAPIVASTSAAPAVTTYTTTTVMPSDEYVSSGGSYCTLPGGGQVFVSGGVSPSDYGC